MDAICLTDQPNEGMIFQPLFVVGKKYQLKIYVSGSDGVVSVSGVGYIPAVPNNTYLPNTIVGDGELTIEGIAYNTNLTINLDSGTGACIDSIFIYEMLATNDFELFQAPSTYVPLTYNAEVINGVGVFTVDWNTTNKTGIWQIVTADHDLISNQLDIQLEHPCTLLLRWACESDAYGFAFLDNYPLFLLRTEAKLGNPNYEDLRNEQYADAIGRIRTLYNSKRKISILRIAESPEYVHDSINIGLGCDLFVIDFLAYAHVGENYTPTWRNSSQLAPSSVELARQFQHLVNNSCN